MTGNYNDNVITALQMTIKETACVAKQRLLAE